MRNHLAVGTQLFVADRVIAGAGRVRSTCSTRALAPLRPDRGGVQRSGFIPNGAKTGVGIMLDCIRPIVIGTAQRVQAAKPLPQIDPQVVMACKEESPNFGTGGATSRPSAQPTTNQSGT